MWPDIWFALTDFAVVLGAGFAIWLMRDRVLTGPTLLVGVGLALMALAALTGTIRFATGQIDEWAAVHSITSGFAAIAGLGLVMLGQVMAISGFKLQTPQYALVCSGAAIAAILILLMPGAAGLISLIGIMILAFGIGAGTWYVFRGNARTGALWIGCWLLLGFISTFIGGSRELSTFGVANWHIYHISLGVWAVLVGLATIRLEKENG